MTLATVPKQTGSFETKDGAQLYYEIRGEGEPLVLVYGIACLLNHWHHQIHYFSRHYKVYAFDLRGHQASTSTTPEHLTVSALADDLIDLLDHWGLKSAHFAGHSFGVPILIEAYGKAPERMKSLTFINGFAHNPIKGMFGLDVVEPFFHFAKGSFEKSPALWKLLWKSAIDNPLAILVSGVAGGFNLRLTQLKDIEVYARGVAQLQLDVFIPMFDSLMTYDGREIAASIDIPTLIITGEKDFVTPFKFQESLHHSIKGSELVRIPYGSHCCQLDFPDYVNLKMEHFLKGVR